MRSSRMMMDPAVGPRSVRRLPSLSSGMVSAAAPNSWR